MSSENMYRLLVITVFVLLITIGLYIGVTFKDKNSSGDTVISNNDDVEIYKDVGSELYNEENLQDVTIKYVDIYSECGHEFEKNKVEKNTTVDKARKGVESEDQDYVFGGEQNNILIFERVHNGKCPNHYKVFLDNEIVVVYKINQDGKYELYQQTEITKYMIREDLVERLEKGILVDSLEDLFSLMEDIES